jgi:probable 2-oxoglutarate dehydrogenase E1 component DHKTD1
MAHLDPLTPAPTQNALDAIAKIAGSDVAALVSSEWAAKTKWDSAASGAAPSGATTVKEGLLAIANAYCGTAGVEYSQVDSEAEAAWFRDQIESVKALSTPLSVEDKRHINHLLVASETFDQYLGKKFGTLKRYGMEGCEASMVAIDAIIRHAAAVGTTTDTVIGMAHRGRLNVLLYLFNFNKNWLFYKLRGQALLPNLDYGALDDVLSHLSASTDLSVGAKKMHVSLIHNPSHLEAVNPVALGKAYAKQQRKSPDHSKPNSTMCMMVHGDAALIGQGVNAETAIIGGVGGYNVGGVVHVVTNNQLGFTAFPKESRPTRYATDLAKMTGTPVIHVNADDPEAVLRASKLAVAYREKFHKDIYVDVIGWRKWGHNELDEPAFTQPTMYSRIRNRPTTPGAYSASLIKGGVMTEAQLSALKSTFEAELDKAFTAAQTLPPPKADELHLAGAHWGPEKLVHPPAALRNGTLLSRPVTAGESVNSLLQIGRASVHVPAGAVTVHERLQRTFIEARLSKLNDLTGAAKEIDWATAEALAFGTCLLEGNPVRISGQDSARGTFSQRHARLVDQSDESKTYIPLANLSKTQAPFECISSPLSEFAVLGFEYGYSAENPKALTIWEAQFGDFGTSR